MSDSAAAAAAAAAINDNDKNSEILNNRPQPSFSLKASMLRPSAFGNSNSTASTSTKSILRPSSFSFGSSSGSSSNANTSASTSTSGSTNYLEVKKSTEAETTENEASPVPTPTSSSPTADKSNSSTTKDEESKGADSTTGASLNPVFNQKPLDDVDDEDNNAKASSSEENKIKNTVTVPTTQTLLNKSLFVPKATNLFAATSNSESTIGFVFGQNIHERTANAPENSSSNDDSKSESTSSSELFAAAVNQVSSTSVATSSGGSGNGHGANGDAEPTTSAGISQSDSKESSTVESLTKVAQAYEESRGLNKRKYDEVETITGEENEINVLNVNCKLFAFISSNWEERGPGSLRLNDPLSSNVAANDAKAKCSRVVFRTSGNLRVLLNTKVWSGMVVEKPSQKSLRLTAVDPTDGQVKIFLAMARPDDISSLYNALKKRVQQEKDRERSQSNDSDEATSITVPDDSPPATKRDKKE